MVGSSWKAAESSGLAPIRSPAATVSGVAPRGAGLLALLLEQVGEVGRTTRLGGAVIWPLEPVGGTLQVAVEVVEGQQVELDVVLLGLRPAGGRPSRRRCRRCAPGDASRSSACLGRVSERPPRPTTASATRVRRGVRMRVPPRTERRGLPRHPHTKRGKDGHPDSAGSLPPRPRRSDDQRPHRPRRPAPRGCRPAARRRDPQPAAGGGRPSTARAPRTSSSPPSSAAWPCSGPWSATCSRGWPVTPPARAGQCGSAWPWRCCSPCSGSSLFFLLLNGFDGA